MHATSSSPLTRPRSSGTLSRGGRGLWLDGRIGIESSNPLPLAGEGGQRQGRVWVAVGTPARGVQRRTKIFFGGTNLPISLKTKRRCERDWKTKLPVAASRSLMRTTTLRAADPKPGICATSYLRMEGCAFSRAGCGWLLGLRREASKDGQKFFLEEQTYRSR